MIASIRGEAGRQMFRAAVDRLQPALAIGLNNCIRQGARGR